MKIRAPSMNSSSWLLSASMARRRPTFRSTPALMAASSNITEWPNDNNSSRPDADVWLQASSQNRGERLALVPQQHVAAEERVLEPPPVSVLEAVQVDEHVLHHHPTVVQTLAQIFRPVGLAAAAQVEITRGLSMSCVISQLRFTRRAG